MTLYLNKNEHENLQNGDVHVTLIPDFGMGYLENHLAHSGQSWLVFCIFHALSSELNFFFDESFPLRISVTGRSCTQNFFEVQHFIIQTIITQKSEQLPMKKYSVSTRNNKKITVMQIVKNNSHADWRTSHAQISEKGCQYSAERKNPKLKFCHKKSTLSMKKSR